MSRRPPLRPRVKYFGFQLKRSTPRHQFHENCPGIASTQNLQTRQGKCLQCSGYELLREDGSQNGPSPFPPDHEINNVENLMKLKLLILMGNFCAEPTHNLISGKVREGKRHFHESHLPDSAGAWATHDRSPRPPHREGRPFGSALWHHLHRREGKKMILLQQIACCRVRIG